MKITAEQHQEIQQILDDFGVQLQKVRESLAYAAPEAQDFHWQRIADDAKFMVEDILTSFGVDPTEFMSDGEDQEGEEGGEGGEGGEESGGEERKGDGGLGI